jgi:hypothetical protein
MTASRSPRRYSPRTLKMLWGRAAGRCAMPDCRVELILDDSAYDPIAVIGEIAHVGASSDAGPRPSALRNLSARDEYNNLILLCRNCHAKIDGQPRRYSVEALHKLKADHEAWVRASLPERGRSPEPWKVVILEGAHPVDLHRVTQALGPDQIDGDPHVLRVCPDQDSWAAIQDQTCSFVQDLLNRPDRFGIRLAVFPLAPISACLLLGHFLADRPHVRLFQYHRHRQSWEWEPGADASTSLRAIGIPRTRTRRAGQVIVRLEVSATVHSGAVRRVCRDAMADVRLQVAQPSTGWLRAREQLDSLGQQAHELFELLRQRLPRACTWHLLVAAPAPVAVRIGQALNPTMIPRVQLYEFHRASGYVPSVQLGGYGV